MLRRLTIPVQRDGNQRLAISPDARTLVVEGTEVEERKIPNGTLFRAVYRIHLFELAGGQERVRMEGHLGVSNGFHAVAFSPDGKLLASTCGGERIEIWDAATGKRRFSLRAYPSGDALPDMMSLAFSPDGRTLASAEASGPGASWGPFPTRMVH